MSGRFWRSLVAALAVLLSSAPVAAQRTRVDVVDCARDALDLDTLRLRLDLELGDAARASLEEGGDHRLVIRRECRSTEVTVRVEDLASGFAVERVVDLADTRGVGRSWALALVIGDLFERGERISQRPVPAEPAPAEPATELDRDPPTNGFLSWRMERPYITAPPQIEDAGSPSSFRVGAASRLYFSELTLLGGAYVGVQVDWVALRVVGLGTSASNDQADLTGAMILVEGALRAVELEDPVYRFGLHFTIAGGLVHSETLVDGETESHSGATIGAGARAGFTAIFSPQIEADVNLSVGYDVGQAMAEGVADARGIYMGLDLGLRLPL